MTGFVTGMPRMLLRLEALSVVTGTLVAYALSDQGWWLFAALLLVPDLSMLGYLAGNRVGAIAYNAAHWYGMPLACIAVGVFARTPSMLAVGLIWTTHIGIDRSLGYGLKYGEGFGFGHLGRIGRAR